MAQLWRDKGGLPQNLTQDNTLDLQTSAPPNQLGLVEDVEL
jgi:hypothetical protein